MNENQQAVIKKLSELNEKAMYVYGKKVFANVMFDLTGNKVVGLCQIFGNGDIVLHFNEKMMIANMSDYLGDAVPHEFAHALAFVLGCKTGHNAHFYAIGAALGYRLSRTVKPSVYGIEEKTHRSKRYRFVGGCDCEYLISDSIHKQIMGGCTRYFCKKHPSFHLSSNNFCGVVEFILRPGSTEWERHDI
jgi:predicted SprT family Zn-dependent metalloprotease